MTTTEIRNRYAGPCVRCGQLVNPGDGYARRQDSKWAVSHARCPELAADAPIPAPRAEFTPTAEQVACVEAFATGADLVIQAGAGTGKTSTALLLAAHAQANGRRGQYTAYNTAIVRDVAAKLPGNVNASTMHSLAFRAVGHAYKHRLDSPRMRGDDMARLLGIGPLVVTVGADQRSLAAGWLASKAIAAVRRFCSSDGTEITADMFERIEGVDLDDANGRPTWENHDRIVSYLLPYARAAWADLADPNGRLGRPAMSHDVYLKVWQLSNPRINADFVLLDEAQDADPVQAAIVNAQRQYGTQIVVVGDSQQSIYEWRGAINALARFEAAGTKVTYLTQSFRFGDAIAEVANGLLAKLGAPLRLQGYGPMASSVGPIADPTAVLCRTNATAVRTVLGALADGRRPYLVGGGSDVAAFCRAALDLQTGRPTNHPDLAVFASWDAVREYVADDANGSDLRLMVRLVDEFGAQVIIDALNNQGSESDADLVVSTAHKAKGREWDRVQIAGDFAPPVDGVLSPPELRLAYVAVTRARQELDITAAPHFA